MKRIIMGMCVALAACLSMQAEYTLEIKRGNYPDGVAIENLNGNPPSESWYKYGWTDQGWTSDNYGTKYNVALSPSHVEEGSSCESALTLPSIIIEEGEWLMWEGCEVYPLFSDTYSVEIRPSGETKWTTLGEFTESESIWSLHMLDLGNYDGQEVQVRFVCRSTEGYMLALNEIQIKKPEEHTFSLINHTPKFFGLADLEDGAANAEISVTNTGLSVEGATVNIKADGNTLSTALYEAVWETGETLSFSLALPLSLNTKTEYQITIESPETGLQTIGESLAYCTSFRRHLYVDKGTGMWCNACPNGTLAIENLKESYGDGVIVAETHNGDPLANDNYFTWLKFYSIPYLMLNHIQSTKGESTLKFSDNIFVPTEMGIDISGLSIDKDGKLCAKASVKTSGSFSATERTFRIGYTLTRNIPGTENQAYYQKNICTLASQKQYRYLPSTMIYPMCYFHDVNLPSPISTTSDDPAFTGLPGSLPESLEADGVYEYEWEIPLPEGYDSFEGMRLVAYILDAGNRNIINCTSSFIDDLAALDEITDVPKPNASERIFTVDGREIKGLSGSLQPGLYIVNGKKTLIR